jgi:hypothetical protein
VEQGGARQERDKARSHDDGPRDRWSPEERRREKAVIPMMLPRMSSR